MDTPGIPDTAVLNRAGNALHAGHNRDRIAADRGRVDIELRPKNMGCRDTADTFAPLLRDSPGAIYSLSQPRLLLPSFDNPLNQLDASRGEKQQKKGKNLLN
jgi:hypothetical protein